jgi:Tfp pilus assembly protein PilV
MNTAQSSLIQGRRAGWSLVESMVGMLVGTVALIALAGVMMSTSHLQSLSLSRQELASVAESKLDQLRAHAALLTSDTVKLVVGGSLASNVANHYEQVATARGRTYTVRWLVASGLNGTRNVTVRATPASPRRNEVPYMDMNTLIVLVR